MEQQGETPRGIEPRPPWSEVELPWDSRVADPVAAISAERSRLGDTFALRSGGRSYLFVFDAAGVESFYALSEADASKGIADWRMLRRKVPDELFAGRRTLPGEVFGREAATEYLGHVDRALHVQVDELGEQGSVELFALTRRLGHRIGLSSWGPPGVLAGAFDELVEALDRLDGAAAFVTPNLVIGADRENERRALVDAERLLVERMEAAADSGDAATRVFAEVAARWADEDVVIARAGIARDVILLHLGSMSNLFAALGWAFVDVLSRPELVTAARSGDRGVLEAACLESIRIAQRSIMMREVVQPIDFATGDTRYRLQAGVTVATLLPLTNSSAAVGLDRFDPSRWRGRRLADVTSMASRELVTTFGHREHSCPAQPFSLAAMTRSLEHLLRTYDIEPEFSDAQPLIGQIGGVARSNEPCFVAYRARADVQR